MSTKVSSHPNLFGPTDKELVERRAMLRRLERQRHQRIEVLAKQAFKLRNERMEIEAQLVARGVHIHAAKFFKKSTHVSSYPTCHRD